jgi:alcohol dehydrogenase
MSPADAFRYHNSATRLIAGPDAIAALPDEVAEAGCRRLMLLASPSGARSAAFARVENLLGERVVGRLTTIPNHSSDGLVERTAAEAGALGIDGLVAFGGGSVSDSAKAIAICLAEGGPLQRHASSFRPPDHFVSPVLAAPKLPIFAVPISASAAEVTPGLGIRSDETGLKLLFWDVKLCPRAIFLDPQVNVAVPAQIMQATLMNALAHCVEGMYSRIRNPVSQGLALEGARQIAEAMREIAAAPEAAGPRMKALVGAHISGMVISNSRVGIHHAVCHCLGSVGGLSHGESNSIMLPHAMRFNAGVSGVELARMALAIGPSAGSAPLGATPEAAIAEVEALQQAAGVTRRLRDTRLTRDRLPEIAEATLHDRGLFFNPRRVSQRDEILPLLESAW